MSIGGGSPGAATHVAPGATAFAVMSYFPNSSANVRVICRTAALDES